MKIKKIIPFEDVNLTTYLWKNETVKCIGTIQIFHGMAEHILRYDDFAEILAKKGYIVIGHDHYAHGNSTVINKIGVIETGDFMKKIIDACKAVHNEYSEYFTKNNFLFAHSMGSMAAQRYIQLYPDDFNKVILCGTDIGNIKYKMSIILTNNIIKKYGSISYTKIVKKFSMDAFNKKFKAEHPSLGWLSVNKENIANYENDQLCGAEFPTNYYNSISKLLVEAAKPKNIELINKESKILLIAGIEDPVTNFTKSTNKLLKLYKKHNIIAKKIIYNNARHELLNENENTKTKVINDIIEFYNA